MYIYTFKILLLGDSAVKTALVKNYCNFFNPFESSTGVDFSSKTIELDGRKIKLQLWVISSEERFKFYVPTYVRGADGAIIMYDIGNHNSLAHIGEWLVLIRKGLRSEDQFRILLAGVNLGLEEDHIISSEEGRKVAKQYNLDGFIECSAKTGEHVDEMFEELVKMIIQKFEIGTTVRDWVSEIRFYHEKEKVISEIEEIKRSLSKSSLNLEMKEEMKRIGSLIEDVRRRLNQNSEKAKRPPSNLSIYLERHEEAERIQGLIGTIMRRLWLIQQDIRRNDQIREEEETKRFSLSADWREPYHKMISVDRRELYPKKVSEIEDIKSPLSRLAIEESDENIDISYINLSEHIPYRTIKKKEGEFKVNEFLTLKLENNKTCIYIKGKRFYQCIRLILEPQWDNLSIGLPPRPFHFHKITITPNQEFWGHCSNLQAWAENDYDPRLLNSNISFYLLKALSDAGDPKAKAVFQERLKTRHLPAINCRYLSVRAKFFLTRVLKEIAKYQPYFDEDGLKSLLEGMFSR